MGAGLVRKRVIECRSCDGAAHRKAEVHPCFHTVATYCLCNQPIMYQFCYWHKFSVFVWDLICTWCVLLVLWFWAVRMFKLLSALQINLEEWLLSKCVLMLVTSKSPKKFGNPSLVLHHFGKAAKPGVNLGNPASRPGTGFTPPASLFNYSGAQACPANG